MCIKRLIRRTDKKLQYFHLYVKERVVLPQTIRMERAVIINLCSTRLGLVPVRVFGEQAQVLPFNLDDRDVISTGNAGGDMQMIPVEQFAARARSTLD